MQKQLQAMQQNLQKEKEEKEGITVSFLQASKRCGDMLTWWQKKENEEKQQEVTKQAHVDGGAAQATLSRADSTAVA